ncbi:amidohydrolase [Chloroflexota bacterium]
MPVADLILKNARVITMDSRQPAAEAVAISGDRLQVVGSNDGLESVTGTRTRIIDCEGKTLLPGFNDAHCHLFSLIRKLLSVDLSPPAISCIADIKEAIFRKAQGTPAGKWLSGTGYNEFYLAEKCCPTRRDIDEVAPNHPVVLSHRGLHACVFNSAALSLAGITIETPDPPGGIIDRDLDTGEPTGVLYEMLGYVRERVLPSLSDEELNEGITLANKHYLAKGITSLQEATVSNDYRRWQTLRGLKQGSKLKSRVYMMLGAQAQNEFLEAGLTTGCGDGNLRLGGVKIMLSEATGQLQPPQSELNRQVLESHRDGFQLAFHAIEENTVAAAITALEYLSSQCRLFGRRHRIEHCSECPPSLLERLSMLPVAVVTQPPFVYYSGERYLATVAPSQLPWLYRIKSLLDSGLVVAGSSDSPIVPDNPLVGIYAAVTRTAESGQRVLPHEGVSASRALALYTANAAYASFEEGIKGSIAPGKLADMVVLSDDPTRVLAEGIKDIKVEMTILGGRVVWEA